MSDFRNPFQSLKLRLIRNLEVSPRLLNLALMIFMWQLLSLELCHGQKIDSLKKVATQSNGIVQADLFFQIAFEYIDHDNTSGLSYANKALEIAKIHNDTPLIVKASRLKALAYRRIGSIDSSLRLSLVTLPLAKSKGLFDDAKHLLNGLTTIYTLKSSYDKALRYSLESLELRQQHGTPGEVSVALVNIGLVYFKLEDLDKALEYYLKALKLRNQIGDRYGAEIHLINIGLCYAYKGDFSRANDYLLSALSTCNKDCSDEIIMNSEFCYGIIHSGRKDYAKAVVSFKKSLEVSTRIKNERFRLDNIVYLSKAYISLKDEKSLFDLLSSSEKLVATGLKYNEGALQLYTELIKLYERSGNKIKVETYQRKYIHLKDSLYNYQFTRNLMRTEADYMERESKAKLESQSKILRLNGEVIARQRYINIFVGLTALLLAVIVIIALRNIKLKKFANRLLEEGVKERTIELEAGRMLLERSLDERNLQMHRISTNVKSTLVTIKGLCILGKRDENQLESVEYLNKIDETSDQLLLIVNRFVKDEIEERV